MCSKLHRKYFSYLYKIAYYTWKIFAFDGIWEAKISLGLSQKPDKGSYLLKFGLPFISPSNTCTVIKRLEIFDALRVATPSAIIIKNIDETRITHEEKLFREKKKR